MEELIDRAASAFVETAVITWTSHSRRGRHSETLTALFAPRT